MSERPYEIIAAPFTVWLAAVGTSYPAVDANPSASWTKAGSSGDKNISEDGVSVQHPQTLEFLRTLGSQAPVKAFRTEEDLIISFTLFDMRLEMYKYMLNGNAIVDTAAGSGTPGYRALPIRRGGDVTQYALLVRGLSAYDTGMNLDFRVPRVVHSGAPEIVSAKGEPMGLLFEFTAVEDPDYAGGRLGELVMQDALAT